MCHWAALISYVVSPCARVVLVVMNVTMFCGRVVSVSQLCVPSLVSCQPLVGCWYECGRRSTWVVVVGGGIIRSVHIAIPVPGLGVSEMLNAMSVERVWVLRGGFRGVGVWCGGGVG